MLTSFDALFSKYQIQPASIAHLGSSDDAKESPIYARHCAGPTVFVEALPKVNARMADKISMYRNQMAFCACLSDTDGEKVQFHIANNAGQSSSMLEFGTHKEQFPTVEFIHALEMTTKRFDTLLTERRVMLKAPVFLNIDVQGAELKVLRGIGAWLAEVHWAYIEVNRGETYKGNPLVEEIDAYMRDFGLTRVETFWFTETSSWGDAAYLRNPPTKTLDIPG